jgi:hypothetical protein
MTKKQMALWQKESIEQAVVVLTKERYLELQRLMSLAGEVC